VQWHSCERGNELSDSVNSGQYVEHLTVIIVTRNTVSLACFAALVFGSDFETHSGVLTKCVSDTEFFTKEKIS
jgi:hypothetical protein